MSKEHLHFLGISGHAMRSLALSAREQGSTVTGADAGAYPPGSDWLDEHDFTWWREWNPAHLAGVTKVILTGSIAPDNPEVSEAQKRGIPVLSFAEYVGSQTASAHSIVVAGTHGKTTTSSLLAWIFQCAGENPDYLIGITPHNFETSVRLRGMPLVILEGDEYRASQLEKVSKFSYYHPDVLLVTNVEFDHPDFFSDISDVCQRFDDLIGSMPPEGRIITHAGVELSQATHERVTERYDSAPGSAQWWAESVEYHEKGLSFAVYFRGDFLTEIDIPLYGKHNVANTVGAIAVASGEGIALEVIRDACRTFQGATRRFSRVSKEGDAVTVLDDYAHHPTEIAATLNAAAAHFDGRVIALFRPHTFSRTAALLPDYKAAFESATAVVIPPIEGARESMASSDVSSSDVAAVVGKRAVAPADRETVIEAVVSAAQPGDVVISMTVNGYEKCAEEIALRLREKF
jgi:UDP-N-acetylmuramate: L-alanyl-gamma-D-glutamyl-meso-diaminopimelate ligase